MPNPGPASAQTNITASPESNIQQIIALSVNVGSLASVPATTVAEQQIPISGLLTTDVILSVSKPTSQVGLGIANVRVSANGMLGLAFVNPTSAAITPTANEIYSVVVGRIGSNADVITSIPLI
jgi:hypothetical protein